MVASPDVSENDSDGEITLSEDKSMSLNEAIDWWVDPEPRRSLVDTKRLAIVEQVRSYMTDRKLDEGRHMLPLLWLRLFLEAGVELPRGGIDAFLELERERQHEEKLMLYLRVADTAEVSGKKKRYLAKKYERFSGRMLIGWTALEMLLMRPPRKGGRDQRWPYEEQWRAVERSRKIAADKALVSIDAVKAKWNGLSPLIESALTQELVLEGSDPSKALVTSGASDRQRRYKTELTLIALATEMQKRHPAIQNYSPVTLAKVLGAFVQTHRGRHVPPAMRKEQARAEYQNQARQATG